MKQTINTLTLILLFGISYGQNQLTTTAFKKFCDTSGLQFTMPKGYKPIAVKENRNLEYTFAVINADSTMEIRYSIWSLKPALEQYENTLKDPKSTMIPPNNMYKGRIQANVLNMTGGQWYDIHPFPDSAVQSEFRADAGGSCFLEFNCAFGQGYKYGQFIYLHKDDTADVFVTFMSNSKETHVDLMRIGFHSLKFK